MSWIDKTFFRSVKFRIAAVYALLLIVSFLALFMTVFVYNKLELNTIMDRDLSAMVDRMSYEYLTGKDLPGEYIALDRTRVKEAERVIRGQIPDFGQELIFGKDGGNKEYLAIGSSNGKQTLLKVDADGKVTVVEVLSPVHDAGNIAELTRKLPLAGRQYDYFWMCKNTGGEIFGSSIDGTEDQGWIRNIKYEGGRKVRFEYVKAGRQRLRAAYRVLPDNKVMGAARSLHDLDSGIERFMIFGLAVGAGVLFLSLICSYLIACRLCRGVDAVSAAADAIAHGGDYSCRVRPHYSGSEVDNMLVNFNTMLGNTEKLMDELRTISDNIAHDLRTPLTRMLGRAELAVTGDRSLDNYEKVLAENVDECRRMLSLINTMLDISKTEAGTARLQIESVDVAKLLEQSVELFEMLASRKHIQLKCRLPEMPAIIYGDRMKLQQMIANLLDNAIKFTPEGGFVQVNLQLDSTHVVLNICDNGCGMSETELSQVFKRFFRADSSRSLPGNGLGMSLVQAIVNAHNGTIEISSQAGEGTSVRVSLPF